ncbi:hypothetical protein K7432_015733 [Basidiobolus ranarum]|uniref:Tyrosinase copper-binding domain-containing protein n=1 Tax=Basidiobolus ranarum TaxID=34480 RepID=A0ABR2VMN0_9FUNG
MSSLSVLFHTVLILLWDFGWASQCSKIHTRKEIRELSTASRFRFIRAINQLKRNGEYDRITRSHNEEYPYFHRTALFFPWHRLYIRRFEQALQRINSDIALPYWDWTKDADSPADSPVFTWFGGDGRWKDGCVTSGPFAGWVVSTPNRHCLKRTFNWEDSKDLYSTPEDINEINDSARSYHELRSLFEGQPHGGIHHFIGGDMDETWSSNDPLFWIHHAYVDKVWWDWQNSHLSSNEYNGRTINGQSASLNDDLPKLGLQVSQVIDIQDLCYTYSKNDEEERQNRDEDIEEILDEIAEDEYE